MRFALAIGAALLLLVGQAAAQGVPRPVLDKFFPVGRDFCFARVYDAAHLRRHAKQLVSAIFVGGRNAQRSAREPGGLGDGAATTPGNVFVTVEVRFRDASRSWVWPGACVDDDADAIRCKIFPHRNQDIFVQGLTIRQVGDGITIEAGGDWRTFRRAAAADDGSAGLPDAAPDDRVFRVARLPAAACSLSQVYWSPKGATDKLLGALP